MRDTDDLHGTLPRIGKRPTLLIYRCDKCGSVASEEKPEYKRRAAAYVDKILKGAKSREIPVKGAAIVLTILASRCLALYRSRRPRAP